MDRSPSGRRRAIAVAVTVGCCLALVGASIAAGGGVGDAGAMGDGVLDGDVSDGDAAAQAAPGDEFEDGSAEPLTRCFIGEGYPITIGDPPTTIDAVVHLSVLTDASTGGEFGVELAGTNRDTQIVTLAAGVRLNRIGLLAAGANPFAAFDVLYTYELRLPMFEGVISETTYEEDESPIGSAAGAVPC